MGTSSSVVALAMKGLEKSEGSAELIDSSTLMAATMHYSMHRKLFAALVKLIGRSDATCDDSNRGNQPPSHFL